MAKTTHTHKGNCQGCARIQAVDNTTRDVAKHGYTVAGGFFNGVCGGSGHQPMQVERTLTDSWVRAMLDAAKRHDDAVRGLKAGSIVPKGLEVWDGKAEERDRQGVIRRGAYVLKPWAELGDYQRMEAVAKDVAKAEQNARVMRSCAGELKRMADAVHGTDLPVNADLAKPAPLAVDGLKWTDKATGTQYEVGSELGRGKWNIRWTRKDGQTGKSWWTTRSIRNGYEKRVMV